MDRSTGSDSKGGPAAAPRMRTADREQTILRPTHIDELLPAWHRARVIWEFTGGLDLTPLRATIKAVEGHAGAPAIDPRILLAVWMYAISEGVGKARHLDRLCASHDAYRWILGGVTVNDQTLSDFRRRHESAVAALLTESLGVLLHEGLVTLEHSQALSIERYQLTGDLACLAFGLECADDVACLGVPQLVRHGTIVTDRAGAPPRSAPGRTAGQPMRSWCNVVRRLRIERRGATTRW